MTDMTEQDDPTTAFEHERNRLLALAYRMLGVRADAEDIVQEAWLRWSQAAPSVEDPPAWLTTVVTRLSLDRLRSAQHRRESYVGPWLPEPVVTTTDDPWSSAASSETLTLHFLTVLERLAPVERAVFLLHDVFGVPFDEVAPMVERTPAATRKVATRARDRVRAERRRFDAEPDAARRLADSFIDAVTVGDLDGLRALLSEDVVHTGDGGPEIRAARRPVVGRERVARFFVNLAGRLDPDGLAVERLTVNAQPAVLLSHHGRPTQLLVFGVTDGQISTSMAVLNPAKLTAFDR